MDKLNYDILEIRDYYPSSNNPSSSTWVYNQVFSLQELGFKPLVISPTPLNPLKKILKNRYKLYDFPSTEIDEYKGTKVLRPPYIKIPNNHLIGFTLKGLSNCIFKHGNISSIKLIHAHFGQNGFAAIKLKNRLNVPLITSFYGYDSGRLSKTYLPFYKNLIKEGDLFLALSENMKQDLINLGFPENKILIHHLGINSTEFNPINNLNNKFTLLTVARLDPVKGVQYVLEAFALFLKKYPNEKEKIQYKVIGGGIFEQYLKDLTKNLKIENNVIFINNLILPNSREIVKEEMQKCDIFLLCSSMDENGSKEGTPIVLMEAQACGKPCVSTYHAGIPEVVINNYTGILTKEKSIEEILTAIENLYFNENIRTQFGKNAQFHISKEFNNDIQMQRLTELIKNTIDENK